MQNWMLIALSICAGVAGQVAIKVGVSRAALFHWPWIPVFLQSPLTILGLALYGLGAISWIAVLKRLDLSYAYPFAALNFVLIVLVSYLFLGEQVPPIRWFGLGLICMGVVFVAQGAAGQ